MLKFSLVLFCGLFLIGCSDEPSQKQLRELFEKNTYELDVIQKLYLYDSLKNVLNKNIDTIFKFRNEKNIVASPDENGKTTERQGNSDFYAFYKGYGLENMPKFIFPKVDTLFKILGERNIKGFELYNDGCIEIKIKDFYDQKINADVLHKLIWKRVYNKTQDPLVFMKDTILAPGWTYLIYVEAHRG